MLNSRDSRRDLARQRIVIACIGLSISISNGGCSSSGESQPEAMSVSETPDNGSMSDDNVSDDNGSMSDAGRSSRSDAARPPVATMPTGGATMSDAGKMPMSDAGQTPMPDAGASSTGMSDAAKTLDCTPLAAWSNPGKVEISEVKPVPENAGTGVPFGHAKNLEMYEYVEQEFFFSGNSPDFTSRFLVLRPSDPAKFSGTVYVEWYNVSGTMDVPVMWSASQEYFMREGHVYVGVSAQEIGALALPGIDADRYAPISHPGDTYANTIFSRAGAAIRAQPELVLGPCMNVHAVIGMGQSQSSARLSDYAVNAQGTDQVYDALLLHSGGTPPANPPCPTFVVRTMNEGNAGGDGPNLVEWDVAAASHNDKRLTEKSFDIIGEAYGFAEIPFTCQNPMNDYPAYRVYNAVLDWMSRWVRNGERPPKGMPFEMSGGDLALDELGNVKGGVRLPDVDVPIKTYSRDNGPAEDADIFSALIGLLACGLAGTADPLSPQQLMELYPTHEDYLQKYTAAADKALSSGYLLKKDYDELLDLARAAPVPK